MYLLLPLMKQVGLVRSVVCVCVLSKHPAYICLGSKEEAYISLSSQTSQKYLSTCRICLNSVACVKAFSSSNANQVAVRHSVRVSLSIHKFLSYQMDTSGELLVMITRIGLERLLIQEMDCQQHASQFKGQQFKSSLV